MPTQLQTCTHPFVNMGFTTLHRFLKLIQFFVVGLILHCVLQRPGCDYGNYLFDLSTDPNEATNLWLSTEHQKIKEAMINRAEELASQQSEYGTLVVEFMQQHPPPITRYFEGNDWYLVPWDCDVIE